MISDLLNNDFRGALERGKKFFQKYDYIRILAHYDGDGTSAAIILSNLLVRNGKKFHLGFVRDLSPDGFSKRIMEEPELPTIIVDAGSDQVKRVPEGHEEILVLDHHFYDNSKKDEMNINARDYGIDGTREACGATMAFIFAVFIEESNSDLLPFMISGAIADKQDISGFRGINKTLIEKYGKGIEQRHILNIEGETVLDALVYSLDPFIKNISGSLENTKKVLESLSIDINTRVDDLSRENCIKLARYIGYMLSIQGCQSEALSYIEKDELFLENGFSASALAKTIVANSEDGNNNIPVEFFLGNTSLKQEMIANRRKYETRLIDYISRSFKSITIEKNLQFFYAPGSEMTGAISGELMLFLVNQDKPLIGFNAGETATLISSRGNRRMVEKGLNLSIIMKECTAKVGGSGGGHDIAAGGSIPKGMERQFIEIADEMIGKQLQNLNV
ncbi:MAG: DHH family phosphoesterase [Cuniculiplasma sp.]